MSDGSLLPVHEHLLRIELDWAERFSAAAKDRRTKVGRSDAVIKHYERYVPSMEVKLIASFLFMLRACGIDDGAKIRHLAELHDARMEELLADRAQLEKYGRKEEAIREAKFVHGANEEALRSMVYAFRPYPDRPIALDAAAFGRFLVEFRNKTQIREALTLLRELGFFTSERVGPRSNLFVTTGEIEDLYATHLAATAETFRTVAAALPSSVSPAG